MDVEDVCLVIIGVMSIMAILFIGSVGVAAIVSNGPSITKAWCASIGDTQYASGHCFKNGIELKMGAQEGD